jgi:uncharacterized membrane protein
MPVQPTEKSRDLIPVKIASELVPYSRDYITRLARDSRVTAIQIDRQWFVDRTSLLNFHAHSEIEDSVRSRRLSQLRKSELEARIAHEARLEVIAKNLFDRRRHTLAQTVLILVCGVGTGVLMLSALNATDPNADFVTAAVSQSDWSRSTTSVTHTLSKPFWFEKTSVSESTEKMALSGGIVLLPVSATNTNVATDFFSDTVTVEMTSSVTGVIRNGETEMLFVQVPNSAEASQLPNIVSRDHTP